MLKEIRSYLRPHINIKTHRFYLIGLFLCLGFGFGLRWNFIQKIHLYPDEFVTLLAIDMIQQKGLPVLPSGLFYEHGLLYSYVAAVVAFLGEPAWWGRIVSLFFGLATIALTYYLGQRWFSPWVGLIAAWGLTLAPSAIAWSGRVRMYALLQWLVLLTLALLVEGFYRQRSTLWWVGIGTYLATLLTQFVSVALYPPILAGQWLISTWFFKQKPLRQKWFWLQAIAWSGVVTIGFLVKRTGQPKGIEPIQEQNPLESIWQVWQIYSDFSLDVGQSWQALSPFFLESPLWVYSLFALIFIGALSFYLIHYWVRSLTQRNSPSQQHAQQIQKSHIAPFLSLILILTALEMLFLVSADRRDDKYLFMLLPVLCLLGATGLAHVGEWLKRWLKLPPQKLNYISAISTIALLLTLTFLAYTPHKILFADVGEDYAATFNYIIAHWQSNDKILTGTPAAAYYYLKRNDFYAVQAGGDYDYRILPGEVERWLGSPWIHTLPDLNQTLRENTVWLVLERWGLLIQYYDPLFRQNILAQTEFIREDNGVILLKSLPQPRLLQEMPAELNVTELHGASGDPGRVNLLGYTLEGDRLTLYWQVTHHPLQNDYTVFVNIQTDTGQPVTQTDHRPLGSIYPTTLWPIGEIIRETSTLDLPPGTYHLRVGMYLLETGERLWVPSDETLQNMVYLGEITIK